MEMAGTIGKYPGESEISSMGTNSPPFIDVPIRLSDWLVSDGAQVTRPSIDPYREEIEISTFIGGPELRLSAPFFFAHLPRAVSPTLLNAFAKTAMSMGLFLDSGTATDYSIETYRERIISDITSPVDTKVKSVALDWYLADSLNQIKVAEAARGGATLLLRSPASRRSIAAIVKRLASLEQFTGIILDEDEATSDVQLEVAVSLLDRELKQRGVRGGFNILAEGAGVRGSDDIFKLVALGADCVGMGKAALLAVGAAEADREIVLDTKVSHRLENFVAATQKDIKLLAGAAGISNISSTLTGNRELLRSIDLEPSIRVELGVKPAGAP